MKISLCAQIPAASASLAPTFCVLRNKIQGHCIFSWPIKCRESNYIPVFECSHYKGPKILAWFIFHVLLLWYTMYWCRSLRISAVIIQYIIPVPVYACIDWALLERKIFTDSKLKMDMDVHWKPFRVFNYLTDVCVNLILCYPNVTVKDNSKKKNIICSACLLVFMWMFIVFLRLREGNTSKWRS